jgi:hypothetical protein
MDLQIYVEFFRTYREASIRSGFGFLEVYLAFFFFSFFASITFKLLSSDNKLHILILG